MKTINITIENTVMHPDSVVAGYSGDNLTTTLSIVLPEEWTGFSYRLLFKTSIQEYKEAFSSQQDLALLKQALTGGQISVIEYFVEVSMIYQSKQNLLQLENQYQKVMAQIYKSKL